MIILGLDTTMAACSLALLRHDPKPDQDEILFSEQIAMRHGQAESLLPAIQAALTQAGLDPQAINAVAATTGPGAFTGIRVGLAAARGFALALGCPGIGVDGFTLYHRMALAQGLPDDAGLLTIIDSRRAEHYVQARLGKNITPDTEQDSNAGIHVASLALDDIAPWLARLPQPPAGWQVTGDLATSLGQTLTSQTQAGLSVAGVTQQYSDPVMIARLGLERLRQGDTVARQTYPLDPIYHRPPDATPAKPTRIWLADQR
ncbi:MAG: tRNA (adenosine(37)-N6)-threonylcarbamoyltransferase complex dimerization subunit type 1 TsaB [Pseudomonadota bacterium]